jgi:hypothetical protein
MNTYYEVETAFIYGWENVWRDEDDALVVFRTYEEASMELNEHLDMQNEIGSMQGDPEDYRIVKVTREVIVRKNKSPMINLD